MRFMASVGITQRFTAGCASRRQPQFGCGLSVRQGTAAELAHPPASLPPRSTIATALRRARPPSGREQIDGQSSLPSPSRRNLLLLTLLSGVAPQVAYSVKEASAAEVGAAPGNGPTAAGAENKATVGGVAGGPEAPMSVAPSSGEEAALKEGARRKTVEQLEEEARLILEEEEAAAAAAKQQKRKNKLQELQEIRGSLKRKQVEILQKQQELLDKDQTVAVLTQELELERNLRELLIREKEKAEEQAKLALGLCGMNYLLP